MPKIATVLTDGQDSQKAISLLLSRDALFLDADGVPSPGIQLSAAQARALAERLRMLASQAQDDEATNSAKGSGAILVVHDGTRRGDRAFDLALTMARDSETLLHLHVRDQPAWDDAGDVVAQCARQLGVMQSVAARCSAEAARQEVRMKPCVIAVDKDDNPVVAPEADIDFLIMPLSDDSSEENRLPENIGRYVVLVR